MLAKGAAGGMNTSVPKDKRRNDGRTVCTHAVKHWCQPVVVHDRIVLQNDDEPCVGVSQSDISFFALRQQIVMQNQRYVREFRSELVKVPLSASIGCSRDYDDAKQQM